MAVRPGGRGTGGFRSDCESQILLERTVAIGELHGNLLPSEKVKVQKAGRKNPLNSLIKTLSACGPGVDSVCWQSRGSFAIIVTEKIVPFHFIFVMVRIKVVFSESMKGTSFVLFLDR